MELYISQLVLEVTRRCNMACAHCMRGDAENIDMPTVIVDKVLDAVAGHGIGSVTFTGGEPTLNVSLIQYFVDQVKARKIGVGNFFVVTNGKVESIELLHALIDLYDHCDDNEVSGLVCSSDKYHEGIDKPRLYTALKFFREEGHGPQSDESIIMEGRAAENCIGYRDRPTEDWEFEINDEASKGWDKDNAYVCINNTMHVSSNGNVLPGCDFSFDYIDTEFSGNILRQSLKAIIARQIKKQALKEAA
jgi:organic radical activating enzyme